MFFQISTLCVFVVTHLFVSFFEYNKHTHKTHTTQQIIVKSGHRHLWRIGNTKTLPLISSTFFLPHLKQNLMRLIEAFSTRAVHMHSLRDIFSVPACLFSPCDIPCLEKTLILLDHGIVFIISKFLPWSLSYTGVLV